MNQLIVVSIEGQLVTESRDVAEMIGKRHSDLLESINGYNNHLTNGNFRSLDFFIPSAYEDSKGETRPCYLLTKKGCDMVANKMTGEKGVLFTAAYVTRFEELEKQQIQTKQLTPSELALLQAQNLYNLESRVDQHQSKLETIEKKVDEQITLDHGEQRRLQRLISTKVFEHAKTDDHKRLLYPELHREIKDRFGVASYKDVKRHELQSAIRYVESWIPRKVS